LQSADTSSGQTLVDYVFDSLGRPNADDVAVLVLRRD